MKDKIGNKQHLSREQVIETFKVLGFAEDNIVSTVDIEQFLGSEIDSTETLSKAVRDTFIIDSDNIHNKNLILFRVNSETRSFVKKEGENNHYVALYFHQIEPDKLELIYIDPTGQPISEEVKNIIQSSHKDLKSLEINSSTASLQYTNPHYTEDQVYVMEGNDYDCGVLLPVAADFVRLNYKERDQIKLNDEASKQLGSILRQALNGQKQMPELGLEINEILLQNILPNPVTMQPFSDSLLPKEEELFEDLEKAKGSETKSRSSNRKSDSSGSFHSNDLSDQELGRLILENFLKDDDRCTFFPEERFFKKMKTRKGEELTKKITEIVGELKQHHYHQKDLEGNTIVGAVVIVNKNGETKELPIRKSDKESLPSDLDVIKKRVLEEYENILEKIEELQDAINLDNKKDILLTALRRLSSNTKKTSDEGETGYTKEQERYSKKLDQLIDKVSRSDKYNILDLEASFSGVDVITGLNRLIIKQCKELMPQDSEELLRQKGLLAQYANHIKNFKKGFFNEKNILNEDKLNKIISLIRGHSESELINRIDISNLEGYDSNQVEKAYVLLVSTNELCSACSNVIPEIKQKAAKKLELEEKGKVQLLYFPLNPHIEGQLYIKCSEQEHSYQKDSSEALKASQVIMDTRENNSSKSSIRQKSPGSIISEASGFNSKPISKRIERPSSSPKVLTKESKTASSKSSSSQQR